MTDDTAATLTETPPDPAEAVSGPENGSQGPLGDHHEPDAGERDDSGRYLSREQSNYRRRMQAAEQERDDIRQERDALREQLDRAHRAEVERIAGSAGLQVPADVWTFGADLDAVRTEAGDIDSDTVTALVRGILRSRPGLGVGTVSLIGVGRGGSAMPRQPRVGLSSLLKPGA